MWWAADASRSKRTRPKRRIRSSKDVKRVKRVFEFLLKDVEEM
mgnify:CR=1 FL=1